MKMLIALSLMLTMLAFRNTARADQDDTIARILEDLMEAQSDCQRGAPTLGNKVTTCANISNAIR